MGDDGKPHMWRIVPPTGPAAPPPAPAAAAAAAPAAGSWTAPPASPAAPAPAAAADSKFASEPKFKRTFAIVTVGLLVAAGIGYVVWDQFLEGDTSAFHSAPKYVLSSAQDIFSAAVGAGPESFTVADTGTAADGVQVDIPAGILPTGTGINIGMTEDDAYPSTANRLTPQIHVSTDGNEPLDGRIQVTLPLGDVVDPSRVVVVSYDPESQTWDAAAPVGYDASDAEITVETTSGTIIGAVEYTGDLDAARSGFDAGRNGWDIADDGTYIQPGGNSYGMSAWSKWVFQRTGDELPGAYGGDTDSLLASRIQVTGSVSWGDLTNRPLGGNEVGVQVASLIALTEYPQVMLVGDGAGAQRAVVAISYDGSGFTVYDPAQPDTTSRISFTETGGFGSYQGMDHYGWTGLPGLAPESTLKVFHKSAKSGDLDAGGIEVTAPLPGETITGASTVVAGSLTGAAANADVVAVYVGSSRFEQSVTDGTFSLNVPIDQVGPVDILVLAGSDPPETAADTVAAKLRVTRDSGVALVVTLTWNQPSTDVDLYVYEPDGEVVYYRAARASTGGELDIDDTDGFGPEHYTLDPSQGDTLESGGYGIRVHYYGDNDESDPYTSVSGRVTITDYTQGQATQRVIPFSIGTADATASGPTSSGPSWADIATVNL